MRGREIPERTARGHGFVPPLLTAGGLLGLVHAFFVQQASRSLPSSALLHLLALGFLLGVLTLFLALPAAFLLSRAHPAWRRARGRGPDRGKAWWGVCLTVAVAVFFWWRAVGHRSLLITVGAALSAAATLAALAGVLWPPLPGRCPAWPQCSPVSRPPVTTRAAT